MRFFNKSNCLFPADISIHSEGKKSPGFMDFTGILKTISVHLSEAIS